MEGFGGIIAFTLGWLLAQVMKLLIEVFRKRGHIKLHEVSECLTKSGGMPSGHAASFVALTTFLGLYEGFNTGIFAVSFGVTLIIIYDAINVRWAVGEQGKLLNSLAKQSGRRDRVKIVEGHTLLQVVIGSLLGVLIGALIFVCWKELFF